MLYPSKIQTEYITKNFNKVSLPKFAFTMILLDLLLFSAIKALGPNSPLEQALIYDPCKRSQVWRFVTYIYWNPEYVLIFICAKIWKFYLLSMLETLNGTATVALVYYIDILFGSSVTSMIFPKIEILGYFGGIFGLVGLMHANVVMVSVFWILFVLATNTVTVNFP